MTYGEKISHLRKSKGMTQEELGKILNVTYQAVSKWERDESLPDFTTMSQMAKVFQVPLSYFEEDGEVTEQKQPETVAPAPTTNYIGTCTRCGKMLKDSDEYVASPKILCKSCDEIRKREIQQANEAKTREKNYWAERARKEQLGRGMDAQLIISLIFALAGYIGLLIYTFSTKSLITFTDKTEEYSFCGTLLLICPLALFAIVHAFFDLINEIRDKDDDTEGYTRNLSFIVAGVFSAINIALFLVLYFSLNQNSYFLILLAIGTIASFTFVSQFMWGGVVKAIFTMGGFTFKLPGFIFSLTVDSILWMIITKILLGFLSVLLFIATTILMALVAMFGSVITFIPSVVIKSVKDKKA
ncbi:MAG: helix-turn-helix domain-containing protein [Clostridia bacterium]|nr:helix-turn-helix domain-containing protein [Clostridia bacterium]